LVNGKSQKTGRLFVLSAPSGVGKTTVLHALLRTGTGRSAVRSVSVTTRPPRPGERHGRDYWFWSRQRFLQGIRRGEFLEWAKVLDHWYGTPRRPVERALKAGKDVFLGIDVQGARQIRKSGLPATTIFLLPPSLAVMRQRLLRRGTETPRQIQERLKLARVELRQKRYYDYAVVNDRLEQTVRAVQAIVQAERFRVRSKKSNGKGV
jgi:guanylate kinase